MRITTVMSAWQTGHLATLSDTHIHKLYTSTLSKAHETRDSLSSSCLQVVLVYLLPFLRNTLFLCASQPKIAKNTKTRHFENSRSFKAIDVDTIKSWSLVLVMISSMSAPICKRFYATRANSSIITTI